jgi:hypothetical protein
MSLKVMIWIFIVVLTLAGCSRLTTLEESIQQQEIDRDTVLYTHQNDEVGYAFVFQVIRANGSQEEQLGYNIFVKKANGWNFLYGGAKLKLQSNGGIDFDNVTFEVDQESRLGLMYGVSPDPTIRSFIIQTGDERRNVEVITPDGEGQGIWFTVFKDSTAMNIPGLQIITETN